MGLNLHAEGVWSCFNNDYGTMKFEWESGLFSNKGWETYWEWHEEGGKLRSDLLRGTHWNRIELSVWSHHKLKDWTWEAFESETREKHEMTCH